MRLANDYFKELDAIELLENVLYRETGNDLRINYSDSSIPVQNEFEN